MFQELAKKSVAITAALLTATFVAHHAHAATVFTDGFGDADRNNDATTDGVTAVVTDAADVGIPWYAIEGASPPPKPTFSVRDDAAGIGAGNALYAESRGSGSEWVGVLPARAALGPAVGDKLVLSFRFRIDSTSPHGIPTAAGSQLRFGLYDDVDNELGTGGWGTGDGDFDAATTPGPADDSGIFGRVPVGGGTAADARIFEELGSNGDVLTGTGTDADFLAGGSLNINDALAHTLTLTLERTADGLLGTLDVDGVASISGTELTSAGINTTGFDYLAIVNSGADFDYLVDSVRLDNILASEVPEPASLGLLAAGLAAGLRRVRRRAAV